jgi:hypothetical protein
MPKPALDSPDVLALLAGVSLRADRRSSLLSINRDDQPESAVTFSSHAKAHLDQGADLARAWGLNQLAERLLRLRTESHSG